MLNHTQAAQFWERKETHAEGSHPHAERSHSSSRRFERLDDNSLQHVPPRWLSDGEWSRFLLLHSPLDNRSWTNAAALRSSLDLPALLWHWRRTSSRFSHQTFGEHPPHTHERFVHSSLITPPGGCPTVSGADFYWPLPSRWLSDGEWARFLLATKTNAAALCSSLDLPPRLWRTTGSGSPGEDLDAAVGAASPVIPSTFARFWQPNVHDNPNPGAVFQPKNPYMYNGQVTANHKEEDIQEAAEAAIGESVAV